MKLTRKLLSIVITICILFAAFPVMSVSAAVVQPISFNYDTRYGMVRESKNRTLCEVGKTTDIYVFPNEGCLLDSITVTDTTNNETITATHVGYFEDGFIYRFTMPNGEVSVNAVFKINNAAGYHSVECGYIGRGTAKFYLNGYERDIHVAKAGDRIHFTNAVADEGYRFDGYATYNLPNGGLANLFEGNTLTMPDYDVELNVVFTTLYNISIVTSGGTAIANRMNSMIRSYVEEGNITAARHEDIVGFATTPDADHLADRRIRIVGASGNTYEYINDRGVEYMIMPEEPVTAYFTFLKSRYNVACSAENGTLSADVASIAPGITVLLTATPNEGFGLTELWYTYTPEVGMDEVRVDIPVDGSRSFVMPEADVEVKAVFGPVRTVEWLDGDGSILDLKTHIEGTEEPTTDKIPTKEADLTGSYEFAGWSAPTYYTGNLTVYRPIWTTIYTVNTGADCTAEPNRAAAGTVVTLTAEPAPEWMYVAGWSALENDVVFDGNTFVMPAHHVSVYPNYQMKKSPTVSIDFSDSKGYLGKPLTVSGEITDNGEALDLGGTVTITFSSGGPDDEGAVSYNATVENGLYTLEIPALTTTNRYVWADYSGEGAYGEALSMDTINIYEVSGATLDVALSEEQIKHYYELGDELDTANLYISLWWTDGTKEDIPVTPDMVSGFDGNTEGWQTLTVACPYATDSELTYNVHVTDPGLPPAEEEKLLGDANCDGIVDIVDATAIQRHAVGYDTGEFSEEAADANGDGRVDVTDATAIQSWLAGLHAPAGIGLPIKKT